VELVLPRKMMMRTTPTVWIGLGDEPAIVAVAATDEMRHSPWAPGRGTNKRLSRDDVTGIGGRISIDGSPPNQLRTNTTLHAARFSSDWENRYSQEKSNRYSSIEGLARYITGLQRVQVHPLMPFSLDEWSCPLHQQACPNSPLIDCPA
jgi:hypothetical protein